MKILFSLLLLLVSTHASAAPLFEGSWNGDLSDERLSDTDIGFGTCYGFLDSHRTENQLTLRFEALCPTGDVLKEETLRIEGDTLFDAAGVQVGTFVEKGTELRLRRQTPESTAPALLQVLRLVQNNTTITVKNLELTDDRASLPHSRVLRGRLRSATRRSRPRAHDASPLAGRWKGYGDYEFLTRDLVTFGDDCTVEAEVTPTLDRLSLVYRIACGAQPREEHFSYAIKNGVLLDEKGVTSGIYSDEALEHRFRSADGKSLLVGRLVRDGSRAFFYLGRLNGAPHRPSLDSLAGTLQK